METMQYEVTTSARSLVKQAIDQHSEVHQMMAETTLTLLRSFVALSFADRKNSPGGGKTCLEQDAAIILAALEQAGRTTMDLSPKGRCDSLDRFIEEIGIDPAQREFKPICYEDYREFVFNPCLRSIAHGTKPYDTLLTRPPEEIPNSSLTCAMVVSLLDTYSGSDSPHEVYLRALDALLTSLTSSYSPHYMFGGATLNGRESHAFVSYYCIRALRDTVQTLKKRQFDHSTLTELLNDIQSWYENQEPCQVRLSYPDWQSFKRNYLDRKLKSLEGAVGLEGIVAVLKNTEFDSKEPDLSQLALGCSAALKNELQEGAWLGRFEKLVYERISGSDAVVGIDQEIAKKMSEVKEEFDELGRKTADVKKMKLDEPLEQNTGNRELKISRKYMSLAGSCWRRAFFIGMFETLLHVRKAYHELSEVKTPKLGCATDAANPILAHEHGSSHCISRNATVADAVRRAGQCWAKSAALTEGFIAKLAKWAEAELYRQLSLHTAPFRINFDPLQLAFALNIYCCESKEQNSDLVRKGLEVLFECQSKDGTWSVGAPLDLNREVRSAVLIASIEIINVVLPLLKKYKEIDKHRQALYAIFNWLKTNRREVAVPLPATGLGEIPIKIIGWSSEKISKIENLDVWMAAVVLQFLAEYSRVLQGFINQKALEGYHISEPGNLKWHDLVDPQLEKVPELRLTTLVRERYIDPFLQKGRSENTSMVLYGPPGTAKTTFAKALAAELGWSIVTITPSDFVRHGIEQSERMARDLFESLCQVREVVVLFDEIDEMLRDRSNKEDDKHGIGILRFLIPGMLPKLQDLKQYGEKAKLIFIIATNYFDRLDPAIRRRGRIDDYFLVPPPDSKSRRCQLESMLQEKRPSCDPDTVLYYRHIAECLAARTAGWVRKDWESIVEKTIYDSDLKDKMLAEYRPFRRQQIVDSHLRIHMAKMEYSEFHWMEWEILRDPASEHGFGRALVPWKFYAHRPNAKEEASTVMKICWQEQWDKSSTSNAFDELVSAIINSDKPINIQSGAWIALTDA